MKNYTDLKFKEWDYQTPLVTFNNEHFFFSEDDIIYFCEDREMNPIDLELVVCEPQYAYEIDAEDIYCDIMPEDCYVLRECNEELADAFDKLNEAIRNNKKPLSWIAGKFRTSFED